MFYSFLVSAVLILCKLKFCLKLVVIMRTYWGIHLAVCYMGMANFEKSCGRQGDTTVPQGKSWQKLLEV